ncbi:hypothetical protein HPB51_013687 [Rhipicephalus microplus]|uniref:EF-hand domain-containing protein n=1 Tax=Rhipicephalus microplus TaxID=6941 RepID=A0A9J6F2Z8_RHIMP|nr:hypothetical protein HPB51_013687 [Rhipicephalus microplus]
MGAKRVVLWRNDSDIAPSVEILETGSYRRNLSEGGEEQSRSCSAIVDSSSNRRFFSTSPHRSAADAASSDSSLSTRSESLDVPSDASELLDEEEAAHFRQAFELFDQDCDGLITALEMSAVMRTLGYEANDVEAQRMVCEANSCGRDGVNFAEFLAVLVQQPHCPREDGQEDIRGLFHVSAATSFVDVVIFDKYDRGYITTSDLRHVMSSLNETVTDREVDAMMLVADQDGDGLISYDEFVAIFTDPDQVIEGLA